MPPSEQSPTSPATGGPSQRSSLLSGLLSGLVFGGWIALCDVWIKALARAGACAGTDTLQDAAGALWQSTEGCGSLALLGGATLSARARVGATAADVAIPAGAEAVWGLALVAIATIVTALVLRWRRGCQGDGLALGTLWGGLCIHAAPRLLGPGHSFTEFSWGNVGFGLADVAIAWAVLWLLWRFVAELRA